MSSTPLYSSNVRHRKRYPEYKSTGLDWLSDVPSHWDVKRLKWTVTACQNGIWGDEPTGGGDDIACIRVPDFDRMRFLIDDTRDLTVRSVAESQRRGKVLQSGDLLIEKSGGGELQPVGAVVLFNLNRAAVSSNFVARMPVAEGYVPEFLRYLHAAMYLARINTRSIKQSIGIQNLDSGSYLDERAGLPPLAEQRAIAAFLDRETAQIDALIEQKQRLIVLLEEKRQAVISHTVTRGLDPNAPLKDSGIVWLGMVPEHWAVKKISRYFQASKGKRGQLLTKEYCALHSGDYPVYSGQTENDGIMGLLDEYEFDVGKDGVLFSTTVGAKAMHVKHLKGRFSLSQNCMIIWPTHDDYDTRFFYYLFQPLFRFERGLIPDHMQASFRMEDLYRYLICVPPKNEQIAISQFLDRQTAAINELVRRIEDGIDRLKEYRSAIISAAVTGQIDVRDKVPT